jgi:hypothetical protein
VLAAVVFNTQTVLPTYSGVDKGLRKTLFLKGYLSNYIRKNKYPAMKPPSEIPGYATAYTPCIPKLL